MHVIWKKIVFFHPKHRTKLFYEQWLIDGAINQYPQSHVFVFIYFILFEQYLQFCPFDLVPLIIQLSVLFLSSHIAKKLSHRSLSYPIFIFGTMIILERILSSEKNVKTLTTFVQSEWDSFIVFPVFQLFFPASSSTPRVQSKNVKNKNNLQIL